MEKKNKILQFYQKNKRMPSYSEIMELVGYKSKNAVSKLVHKLIDAGVLDKDSTGKLIPAFTSGEIPMLGLVEAGIPSLADSQVLDTLNLENYLVPEKEKTFMLEVKGDSMIEAHITEGDLVIAERKEIARDGDIVVAEVDGEWTLKYYKNDGKKVWLLPANRDYQPIYPEHSLRVAAVVKGVIRKY